MQTCSHCNAQSLDTDLLCSSCQADLREYSTMAVTRKTFLENPRVKLIRISVSNDACPACHAQQGTYSKESAPVLPHTGCSHDHGCRCHYEPYLDTLYP